MADDLLHDEVIAGRPATVAYLSSFDGDIVPKDEATVAIARFASGEMLYMRLTGDDTTSLSLPKDTVINMPFGDYTDFEDCVEKNGDKDDPKAFCGWLKHRIEGSAAPDVRLSYRDGLAFELEWDEGAHERDEKGKFAGGGGGVTDAASLKLYRTGAATPASGGHTAMGEGTYFGLTPESVSGYAATSGRTVNEYKAEGKLLRVAGDKELDVHREEANARAKAEIDKADWSTKAGQQASVKWMSPSSALTTHVASKGYDGIHYVHTEHGDHSTQVVLFPHVSVTKSLSDRINLPDVADVQVPSLIGQKPAPKPKRKKVTYKGVSLGRAPNVFEAKTLALTEIPPTLDAALVAVIEKRGDDDFVRDTMRRMATFGATQVLHELVRQGAPEQTLARMPDLSEVVHGAFAKLQADRFLELSAVRNYHADRVGQRRLSAARRDAIVEHMMSYRTEGIGNRYARQAVNLGFSVGRSAAMVQFRRQRTFDLAHHDDDTGQFIDEIEAIAQGKITVDVVVQSAVMDDNTCDECDDADGEEMELGDERQEELRPPYVKCLSTLRGDNKCRCVQIALLSNGNEIDVDELPDEAWDNID